MLRQLCRGDAVRLLGCRPSVVQRNFLRACSSHRSVLSDSPDAAAKEPRWVMLNDYRVCRSDDSIVADANTVADCGTPCFTGQHLRVSLRCATPPASTFLYYDLTDGVPGEDEHDHNDDIRVDIVTAHTDSVILRLRNKQSEYSSFEDSDYFVYRAGAARPPSLFMLPDRDFLTKTESRYTQCPSLYDGSIGLLRRGENDLLVVQLHLWYNRDAGQNMVEFCVFRHGTSMGQWELTEPVPILQDDDKVSPWYSGKAVITVSDRYLCWVDYENGFFLCDMANEASPKVRYVPVPAEVSRCCSSGDYIPDYELHDNLFRMKYSLKMAYAGSSKVKFVSISPHCCCGGPGRTTCAQSRFAFTVTTWTMDLSMDMESPLTWVKDGEIDCEEVWALPGYEGLPRGILECPIVSLNDPNVICFLVSNHYFVTNYNDRKLWMIQLNIKTMTLLSVVQFSNDPSRACHHLPAQFQY